MKSVSMLCTALGVMALLVMLTACGGGGSDGAVTPPVIPPVEPEPEPPAEPEPPVEPEPEPPEPTVRRGINTVPGINLIPLDMMKADNQTMQGMFVLTDIEFDGDHDRGIRHTVCDSYITECSPTDFSMRGVSEDGVRIDKADGTAPFTFVAYDQRHAVERHHNGDTFDWDQWYYDEIAKINPKIVTQSILPGSATDLTAYNGALPYLVIHGAGNEGRDQFAHILSYADGAEEVKRNIAEAIQANSVLYVAGYEYSGSVYRRHPLSTGCVGVESGCIWAPFLGGTSLAGPHVAAAAASVLSVFPDTHYADLAKFTKACAKKEGQGIEEMLRQSGGVGVADFTCMGDVVQSLRTLPTGGSVDLNVNGNAVTMSGRNLVAEFPVSTGIFSPVVAGYSSVPIQTAVRAHAPSEQGRRSGFSLHPVFTDETAAFVGVHKIGRFFASVGMGTREDFYGYRGGHDGVLEAGLAVGHEDAFLRFSRMHSDGGELISSAEGQSYGFTVRKNFRLADVPFTAAAHTDQFLGGRARIPSGTADLKESGWNHRLNLSSALPIGDTARLMLSAEMRLPETGKDVALLAARFWWYF